MNFRQLACFVAVVEEGSFTRAARRIGITQPSLSQHIRALEDDIDGRGDRAPAARDHAHAGGALAPARGARRRARGRARPARGALRARARGRRARDRDGALDGGRPAAALHPALARALSRRRHPPAGVPAPVAARGRGRAGRRRLRDRPAATAHVGRAARRDRVGGVRRRRCRPATRSPRARTVRLEELADREWVLYHQDHGLAGILEEVCRRAGFSPRGTVRTSQAEGARGSRRPASARRSSPTTSCCPGIEGSVLRLDPPIIRDVAVYARTELTRTAASFVEVLAVGAAAAAARRRDDSSVAWPPCGRTSLLLVARAACSPRAAARRSRRGADQARTSRRRSAKTIATRQRAVHAPRRRDRRRLAGAVERDRDDLVLGTPRARLQADPRQQHGAGADRRRAVHVHERERRGGAEGQDGEAVDEARHAAAHAEAGEVASRRARARHGDGAPARRRPERAAFDSMDVAGAARDRVPRRRAAGAVVAKAPAARAREHRAGAAQRLSGEAVPCELLARRRGARAPRARELPHAPAATSISLDGRFSEFGIEVDTTPPPARSTRTSRRDRSGARHRCSGCQAPLRGAGT